MTDMPENGRDHVISRMATDLIGPRDPEETLVSRPSDVYLTGILWPRNTPLAPEEDEKLSVATGDEDQGEEPADQSQASSVPMRRPSTAGLSFAATAAGTPEVLVKIRFATYEPMAAEKKPAWRRVSHAPDPIALKLTAGAGDIRLTLPSHDGLRLNYRCVPFPRGILATVTLVNNTTPAELSREAIEVCTLFQVELEVTPAAGSHLISRPSRRAPVDDEDWSSALLYRDAREFAAGHTCSAAWTASASDHETADCVRTVWIPRATVPGVSPDGHELFSSLSAGSSAPLSAAWLAHAATPDLVAGLMRLCAAYSQWIDLQKAGLEHLQGEDYIRLARSHIDAAEAVLKRMASGIGFLGEKPEAADAFRLANLAMTTQRQWTRGTELSWRPFQLGFLLLTLESSANGDHPDRGTMDLLWFPTGGGKTEAYLGLIAFVSFYRRLSRASPDEGAGVATIMRYTLRLLTTQQFLRASAMICACEAVRRGRVPSAAVSRLGKIPFSIGLWVGDGATPNLRRRAYENRADSSKASALQLSACPCCRKPVRFSQPRPADPFRIFCRTDGCLMAGNDPLPVWTVDEDIYEERPTLLIGTVDKFAQIVRKPGTAAIFATGTGAQPQLILQDELHLISGPLGTLAGLYEAALDTILSADGTRPKIIGSTATIRRAPEQVLALFDRKTCQFPPPGLSADDSGFTVTDPKLPGRLYAGVTTAGRSAKFALQAVSASLLQTAFASLDPAERDHYWTLVTYFNSLRELGGALVLMQDDVPDTVKLIATSRPGETARPLREISELTSRRSQQEIRDMLNQLDKRAGDPAALDVVLATNMVSVGVDIDRLGLMVVNGQPKTMAEYIQATSRVGRADVPGLVIPVLNNGKPRDRSHYETFCTWHSTLYREVEATSVTPFASRARDRALHAVLVAVVRHIVPDMLVKPDLTEVSIGRARLLIDQIAARATRVDRHEQDVAAELNERLSRWLRRAPQDYWNRYAKVSLLQGAEEAAAKRAAGRAVGSAWPTPNSMRGVEPSANYRLVEKLKDKANAAQ